MELTWDVCRGTIHEGPSVDSEEDLPSQGECPESLWEEESGAGNTVRQSYCGPRGSLGWSVDLAGQEGAGIGYPGLGTAPGIWRHKST